MSKIKASIGYPPANGKQMSFRAPCSSGDTDGLIVDEVEYILVDADGRNVAQIPNLWNRGTMVSVILDTINHLAYVQNANTNGYIERTFDNINDQVNQLSSVIADKDNLTPEFVQNIKQCTDTTKLYVLPDGYIYAYSAGEWRSTGIKIADEIPSQIVTSINGQTGEVELSFPPPVYLVTVDISNNADRSFSDIMKAYQAGLDVQCQLSFYRLPLRVVVVNKLIFEGIVADQCHQITIETRDNVDFVSHVKTRLAEKTSVPTRVSQLDNDLHFLTQAPVTSVNGETGDVKTSVMVSLEMQTNGTYTADVSSDSIIQAHNAGYPVYCQWRNLVLPLVWVSDSVCTFSCIHGESIITVSISMVSITFSNTPLSLSGSVDGVPVNGEGVMLTDRKTAKKYVLYVSEGKLMMEESEE